MNDRVSRTLRKAHRAHHILARRILSDGTETLVLGHERRKVSNYMTVSLPQQAFILAAMFVLSLGWGESAQATGFNLYQDGLLTWEATREPDLALSNLPGACASQFDHIQEVGQCMSIRCLELGAAANGP